MNEETLAVIAFLADGRKRNMCIEYETEKECQSKYRTLMSYRKDNKLQDVFDLYKIDKKIYIAKTKKPGREVKKADGR